jgi:hypothetical protein
MFSPENTTLTTVIENQNIANVAVTYVLQQPSLTGTTTTASQSVTLTAVKDNSTVVVDGSTITGYFTDAFDQTTISYRTKDDQFITVTKWADIVMAIANNTLSELYYYKADPRQRVIYDYIASLAPTPTTRLYTDVAFVNGVATITLPDQNGVFVGGADKTLDYDTIINNYNIQITGADNSKYTSKDFDYVTFGGTLQLEFAPSVNYNSGDGVYGRDLAGNIILRQNSFDLNPGRTIVTSPDGRTITLTLDIENLGLYGDGLYLPEYLPETFYAKITTKYVTGKTYHINVDNDWQTGRNQLIKFTNLTKYQQEYLVQWINNNSDTVTWKNNVLDAIDWENSNL